MSFMRSGALRRAIDKAFDKDDLYDPRGM